MAAQSSSILRRALLYVPASSPRMLAKSLGLTSDNITYDLEDSVTPSAKPEARAALRAHLLAHPTRPPSVSELAVRVNPVSSPYVDADLASVAALPNVDAVVVPKVNSASELRYLAQALSYHRAPSRPPPKVVALIESARAVVDLREICAAAPGVLSGLIFAAEDFALDLSITRTPDLKEFLYARSAIVTAARAAGLPSVIDLVCTSYKGEEGLARLEEECRGGKAMGFNGKQCIHPSQVETVQRLFAPSEKEVEWAVRITIADEKAAAAGKGAWTMDGAMIDAPVAGKAKSIVEKAQQCGIDVKSIQEKWKDQEPE